MPESVVEEIRHRYSLIGSSPLTALTMEQGRVLSQALGLPVYVGMRNWKPYNRRRGAPDASGRHHLGSGDLPGPTTNSRTSVWTLSAGPRLPKRARSRWTSLTAGPTTRCSLKPLPSGCNRIGKVFGARRLCGSSAFLPRTACLQNPYQTQPADAQGPALTWAGPVSRGSQAHCGKT